MVVHERLDALLQTHGAHDTFLRVEQDARAVRPDEQLDWPRLVAWLLNRAGTEGQTSASLGGKSETYELDAIPAYIKRGVAKYRKGCA